MAVPKPKSSELIERINRLYQADSIDQLEVERIRREANALVRTPVVAYQGYSVLAMLAALKPDVDATRSNFEAALLSAPGASRGPIRLNFACSMLRACAAREASEIALALHQDYPDDIPALSAAMRTALAAGRFKTLLELFAHWFALGMSFECEPGSVAVSDIEAVVARMNSLGYTDDDVSIRQDAAAEVMRQASIPFEMTGVVILPDGSVRHAIGANVSDDKAVDLSFSIADQIATRFEDTLMDLVTFSCCGTRGINIGEFPR